MTIPQLTKVTAVEEAVGDPLLDARKLPGDKVSPVNGGLTTLPGWIKLAFPLAAAAALCCC